MHASFIGSHALKGQKLLAQGIALGIMAISNAPCKGKSFVIIWFFEAFALTGGDRFANISTQGDALG